MEVSQGGHKIRALSRTESRSLSTSSSAFVSANQSPFFSPRSPKDQVFDSRSYVKTLNSVPISSSVVERALAQKEPPLLATTTCHGQQTIGKTFDEVSSQHLVCSQNFPTSNRDICKGCPNDVGRSKKWGRSGGRLSLSRSSFCISFKRTRNVDVYIGLHGRKPSLLRFVNWLRAELDLQGISCFVADRARCRNSRSHDVVERAMNASSIGIVILSRKSFGNLYSVEELRHFSDKKNLIPIFFDIHSGECLSRDIIEKRGELWEKHGGELWMLYGGMEREWREAIDGLSKIEEWKVEVSDENWRDCILEALVILAKKLGRRSIVDRINRCFEKVEQEEFPFPRNESFVGRKKELSELELTLFGDLIGDGEREYFELKTRRGRKKTSAMSSSEDKLDESWKGSTGMGKDPIVWKESEKEIEMHGGNPQKHYRASRARHGTRQRKRQSRIYGKGIACVSGESGIGKTELLLEYAYRFAQRYKAVLWVSGESKYIRQNYLNLRSLLEVDVSSDNISPRKRAVRSFEEQEEEAVFKVRKELMRDIPFLVIIDNLESEEDCWDQKFIMDLLPRFGCGTHVIISTRLPRVMNIEPMKLSYLSGMEALSLMKGNSREFPIMEVDALRILEEKLGRLPLGLSIVGAILFELPINPSKLLDTINRMPLRGLSWNAAELSLVGKHNFLMQLLDICFSIFNHADSPYSLATRMMQVCGYFAPSPVPLSLLALAAHRLPQKRKRYRFWRVCTRSMTCSLTKSRIRRSEAEAAAMLVRFGVARSNMKLDRLHFHDIVKVYAQERSVSGAPHAVIQAISIRGSIANHIDHLWAACFLLFAFDSDTVVVELKVRDLLLFVNRTALPLAVHCFLSFSRCSPALELLRLCTNALEAAEEPLVSRAGKWMENPGCWGRPNKSNAQLNPSLWQELALTKATVLETRAKLLIRGAEFGLGDDMIRKAIFIRSSICGENHPDTVAAKQVLIRITKLLASVRA